jgi:hypothetical protein
LLDVLLAAGAGHDARLRILRGGAAADLRVRVGERPAS